ncbi:hypothetical protein [Flavobacterium columnare]|uniref:hypothetical protein n=1 Tax=Flavobacterium columnare TaxID=996 RepID=UPI000F4EF634|nr:hypothetical protein [Flavobacterium columnare]
MFNILIFNPKKNHKDTLSELLQNIKLRGCPKIDCTQKVRYYLRAVHPAALEKIRLTPKVIAPLTALQEAAFKALPM